MKNAAVVNPSKKTIFVSVTQGLAGKMLPDIDPKNTPLIDCARGCWRIDPSVANTCDWLMAVNKGNVVGVYEIDKTFGWQPATTGCIPTRQILKSAKNRYYCKLRDIASSVGKLYMHQSVRMYRETQYSR